MCGIFSPAGKKIWRLLEGVFQDWRRNEQSCLHQHWEEAERAFRTKIHVRSPTGGKIPSSVEQHYFRELLEADKERGRRERGSTARVSLCCCMPMGVCWQQPSSQHRARCWAGSPLGILPAGSGSRNIVTANHCNNTIMIHEIILFNTSEQYWKLCPWERGDAKEGEKQKCSGRKTRVGQSSTSGVTETAVMSASHSSCVTGEWVHLNPRTARISKYTAKHYCCPSFMLFVRHH